MRSYRVFNDVTRVRVVWKVAGLRLGALSQVSLISLMAVTAALLKITGSLLLPAAVFAAGFGVITVYSLALAQADPTDTLGERTRLALIRRGLRHRHHANFDLPGL